MISEAAGTPHLLAIDAQRVYWFDVGVPDIPSAPWGAAPLPHCSPKT
ncbi:hypothetical protein SAMN02745121_09056 [Nannocystis exedens]|uniref:Uncharacterized protein n=1 Tax=Nannocystis exedens TaxID=54 RepID=A0A1I2IYJ9_9BACT|nr:hypothetical protein NAEX_01833 [Nannocystis exedens]SFF46810.1 hypothetical protein SAMN02745121_09056 [Nannocystis exedens]